MTTDTPNLLFSFQSTNRTPSAWLLSFACCQVKAAWGLWRWLRGELSQRPEFRSPAALESEGSRGGKIAATPYTRPPAQPKHAKLQTEERTDTRASSALRAQALDSVLIVTLRESRKHASRAFPERTSLGGGARPPLGVGKSFQWTAQRPRSVAVPASLCAVPLSSAALRLQRPWPSNVDRLSRNCSAQDSDHQEASLSRTKQLQQDTQPLLANLAPVR